MVKASIAETASAIVSRGRSIVVPVGGETKKICGYSISPEGGLTPVHMSATRVLMPGDLLSAPAAEIERLRAQGFLDPVED